METQSTRRFEFAPFASWPFYDEVNRRLLGLGPVPRGLVVDLGAGSGKSTRMLADAMSSESRIVGIDECMEDLEDAAKSLERYIDSRRVLLVRAKGQSLASLLRSPAAAVYFLNGIHLVDDKAALVRTVAELLRPGGRFCFNTSFFDGAEPPASHEFYRIWMRRALELLKSRYDERPSRVRSMARVRLGAGEFRLLLEEAGFEIAAEAIDEVMMPVGAFEDLSRYTLWIQGILPGVDLEKGSAVLTAALAETERQLGLGAIPRRWLSIVAVKKDGANWAKTG